MNKSYPILIEQDETGFFVVTCPVFKGCYTQGKTFNEAIANIKEAIELCLEEVSEEEKNHVSNIMLGQVTL